MDIRAAGMEDDFDEDDDDALTFGDDVTLEDVDVLDQQQFQRNENNRRPPKGSATVKCEKKMSHEVFLGIPGEDIRVAIVNGNLDTVTSIIHKGFAVDTVLKSGWTALMYACSCGHPNIVNYLLNKGADPNFQKDCFTPLMAVCTSKREVEEDLLQCVSHLLNHGADPHATDNYRIVPLMYACRSGFHSLAKRFLEHGAVIDAQDAKGWTPLFWAASRGQNLIVRLLLLSGASVDKSARNGQSAANVAYDCGFPGVARVLEVFTKTGKLEGAEETVEKAVSKEEKFVKYGELEMFLSGMELEEYIPAFTKHGVTFAQFLAMTDQDLEKVGVDRVGARKTIVDSVFATHKMEWKRTSLPPANRNKLFTCPEMVSMVSNISDHLGYIDATLVILEDQIKNHPDSLQMGQDVANVARLFQETLRGRDNVKHLEGKLTQVHVLVGKMTKDPQFEEVGLITAKNEAASARTPQMFMVGVACAVLVGIVWNRGFIMAKVSL